VSMAGELPPALVMRVRGGEHLACGVSEQLRQGVGSDVL
jgi:hypothetical protein